MGTPPLSLPSSKSNAVIPCSAGHAPLHPRSSIPQYSSINTHVQLQNSFWLLQLSMHF